MELLQGRSVCMYGGVSIETNGGLFGSGEENVHRRFDGPAAQRLKVSNNDDSKSVARKLQQIEMRALLRQKILYSSSASAGEP